MRDADRFDALSRSLATLGNRRRLLGLLTSFPVGLLTREDATQSAARGRKTRQRQRHRARDQHARDRRQSHKDAHSEACIPSGQHCPSKKPRGKKGKKLSCNQCCQGASTTDASGKRVCSCRTNGAACTNDSAAACCSGLCVAGSCQASTPCNPPCSGLPAV